jgi:hypothetical protein
MSATPPDLAQPEAVLHAVGDVSLRLLAGAVPRKTLEHLKRTLQQTPTEYPWQVVVQTVLADPVDSQQVVQQGLQAQRDWILRGGRETPGKPITTRAKGLLAKLVAQLIFLSLFAVVVAAGLVLLRYHYPSLDIYRALELLPARRP